MNTSKCILKSFNPFYIISERTFFYFTNYTKMHTDTSKHFTGDLRANIKVEFQQNYVPCAAQGGRGRSYYCMYTWITYKMAVLITKVLVCRIPDCITILSTQKHTLGRRPSFLCWYVQLLGAPCWRRDNFQKVRAYAFRNIISNRNITKPYCMAKRTSFYPANNRSFPLAA